MNTKISYDTVEFLCESIIGQSKMVFNKIVDYKKSPKQPLTEQQIILHKNLAKLILDYEKVKEGL